MEKKVINALAFSNDLDSLVCNFLYEIMVFVKKNGEKCENPILKKIYFPKDIKLIEGKVAYVFINTLSNEVYVYLQRPNRKRYKDVNIANLSAESILKVAEEINKVMNP